MALPLTVDVHVDVHEVRAGALLEALDHDRNAVRDLVPHIEQSLFTDNFRNELLLRHIGVSVIVKIMRAFHGIAAQCIEQFLAVVIIADTDGIDIIKDAQGLQLRLAGLEIRRVFDEVGLVDDRDGRAALFQSLDQNHLRFIQRAVGLE